MDWKEAIKLSEKNSTTRIEERGCVKRITIKYKDGSGFFLTSENAKVDFSNMREATSKELNGFNDWQPS